MLWPVSLVVKYTFADGMTALTDAFNDPAVTHALQADGDRVAERRAHQPGLRRGGLAAAGALQFIGKRLLSVLIDVPLSVSPVVVGLALVLAYNPRTGLFGQPLSTSTASRSSSRPPA